MLVVMKHGAKAEEIEAVGAQAHIGAQALDAIDQAHGRHRPHRREVGDAGAPVAGHADREVGRARVRRAAARVEAQAAAICAMRK